MAPHPFGKYLAAALACLLLFASACKNESVKRATESFAYHEGDVVFQSLPHNSLVDAIEGTTKSEWSHCGIVMRDQGVWVVYEALGTVHPTPLSTWVQRGRNSGRFEVYRLKTEVSFDAQKLRHALQPFLGKPYDFHYAPDDSQIYCSELVYKVYERAERIKIGAWETLGSLDWKPFEAFILTIESSVPLEREMITPVALTRSELVERVFAGNNL